MATIIIIRSIFMVNIGQIVILISAYFHKNIDKRLRFRHDYKEMVRKVR